MTERRYNAAALLEKTRADMDELRAQTADLVAWSGFARKALERIRYLIEDETLDEEEALEAIDDELGALGY